MKVYARVIQLEIIARDFFINNSRYKGILDLNAFRHIQTDDSGILGYLLMIASKRYEYIR